MNVVRWKAILTVTTLLANSDDKLMIFFLIFPENRLSHFMQNLSAGDNLHEISKHCFWEKKNYFKLSNVENFTQDGKR